MIVSPLLSTALVKEISTLLRGDNKQKEDSIFALLKGVPVEEQIRILRFLYNKSSDDIVSCIYRIWHGIIPTDHPLDTVENRVALDAIGKWWDAWGCAEGMTTQDYDVLEHSLDELGATAEGLAYFKWVALSPIDLKQENHLWDETRRGAIICLGKYGYNKHMEYFLARHLDDWNTIQIEVVQILATMKSRLLPQIAPWYQEHDDLLKAIIDSYL